jgi:hypothetical protein
MKEVLVNLSQLPILHNFYQARPFLQDYQESFNSLLNILKIKTYSFHTCLSNSASLAKGDHLRRIPKLEEKSFWSWRNICIYEEVVRSYW